MLEEGTTATPKGATVGTSTSASTSTKEGNKKKVKAAIIVFNDGSTETINKFIGVFHKGETKVVDIIVNQVSGIEIITSMGVLDKHVHELLDDSFDPVKMLLDILKKGIR